MALQFPDSLFQIEGNLHPEGPINVITDHHVWAFPTDDDIRNFPYQNNYTDTAQDLDLFAY